MGEIGKNYNLDYGKQIFFHQNQKNLIILVKIYLFLVEKLEIKNWYDTRHFSNDLFSRYLKKLLTCNNIILTLFKQKNLITASFNTKKSHLSIV